MAEYKWVDWDGLKYYHTLVEQLIDDRLRSAMRFGGEYNFADLPSPDSDDVNTIVRVLDSFTVVPSDDKYLWFDDSVKNRTCAAGTLLQSFKPANDGYTVYKVFVEPTSGGTSGTSVDLSNYYTIEQVDAKIVEALAPYATKSYVENKIEAIQTLINTQADDVGKLTIRVAEIEDKLSKEVEPAIEQLEASVLDLADKKANVEDIPSLDGYAKLTDIPDTSGLATETFVIQKIAEAQLSEGEVDLSAFYTKDEIDAMDLATKEYVQQQLADADVTGLDERLTVVETQVTTNTTAITEVQDQADENAASITALDGEIDQINETILTMDTQLTTISQNVSDLQTYGTF